MENFLKPDLKRPKIFLVPPILAVLLYLIISIVLRRNGITLDALGSIVLYAVLWFPIYLLVRIKSKK